MPNKKQNRYNCLHPTDFDLLKATENFFFFCGGRGRGGLVKKLTSVVMANQISKIKLIILKTLPIFVMIRKTCILSLKSPSKAQRSRVCFSGCAQLKAEEIFCHHGTGFILCMIFRKRQQF